MALFRPNDRLPEDERFLKVSNFEEFQLFRERQKLGFNGLLLEAKLSPLQKQTAKAYAKQLNALQKNYDNWFFFLNTDRFSPLKHRFQKRAIPEDLHNALENIAECSFHMLGHKNKTMDLRSRTHSGFPSHQHQPAITYALNQLGTKIITPDNRTVVLQSELVAAFDETVLHAEPDIPYETLKDDPRLVAVI